MTCWIDVDIYTERKADAQDVPAHLGYEPEETHEKLNLIAV